MKHVAEYDAVAWLLDQAGRGHNPDTEARHRADDERTTDGSMTDGGQG